MLLSLSDLAAFPVPRRPFALRFVRIGLGLILGAAASAQPELRGTFASGGRAYNGGAMLTGFAGPVALLGTTYIVNPEDFFLETDLTRGEVFFYGFDPDDPDAFDPEDPEAFTVADIQARLPVLNPDGEGNLILSYQRFGNSHLAMDVVLEVSQDGVTWEPYPLQTPTTSDPVPGDDNLLDETFLITGDPLPGFARLNFHYFTPVVINPDGFVANTEVHRDQAFFHGINPDIPDPAAIEALPGRLPRLSREGDDLFVEYIRYTQAAAMDWIYEASNDLVAGGWLPFAPLEETTALPDSLVQVRFILPTTNGIPNFIRLNYTPLNYP